MSSNVAANSEKAKLGISEDFHRSEKDFALTRKLAKAINALWPRKTASHVSYLTRTEERTVRFWLAAETRMSVEAVAALLKTDDGYQILEAIMGDCKAPWWLATQVAQDIRISNDILKREEKRHKALRDQLTMLNDRR